MKNHMHLILVILLAVSCFPYINQKPKMQNSKTNYFDTNKNVKIMVISDISVNSDTLKSLLVVPNGDYYLEMGKNLEYFNEVMTYNQLYDKILKLGDTLDLRLARPDKLKLNNAAQLYKPFVIMKEPNFYLDENSAWVTGFIVYDPLRGETIFQNKIFTKNSIQLYNNSVLLPLYNNFLDYLRRQN